MWRYAENATGGGGWPEDAADEADDTDLQHTFHMTETSWRMT
jgi:hypothetical protein